MTEHQKTIRMIFLTILLVIVAVVVFSFNQPEFQKEMILTNATDLKTFALFGKRVC